MVMSLPDGVKTFTICTFGIDTIPECDGQTSDLLT